MLLITKTKSTIGSAEAIKSANIDDDEALAAGARSATKLMEQMTDIYLKRSNGKPRKYVRTWCPNNILYVTLPHQSSSSLISFIFCFGKLSLSSFILLYLSIRVQGTLILFLLFLLGLQSRSDIYHLDSFYITDFCRLILEHALYKIYNYVILKHVARS